MALSLMRSAVAALLNLPEDDPEVLAIAVAYKDSVYDAHEVVRCRYGSVVLEFADGWLSGTQATRTRRTAPEHRRTVYKVGS